MPSSKGDIDAMTRTGSSRKAGREAGIKRLEMGRQYLKAAETQYAMRDPGDFGNPVVSQCILAAIAYADAVTIIFSGEESKENHDAAPALLRAALGNRLPNGREKDFKMLLGLKPLAQYRARSMTFEEAGKAMERLRAFAGWAEDMIASK